VTVSAVLAAHHHLRALVPIGRWSPIVGLAAAVVCLVVWRRLARRVGWRPWPTLVALLSLAGVLTLTLAPRNWPDIHRSLGQCVPSSWAGFGESVSEVGGSVESLLNIAMLMPLGCALVLASRRAAWPALLMALLPLGLELAQVVVPGRECSPADWVANASGGLVAVLVGAALNAVLRPYRSVEERPAAFTSS
jgi:VanZ family protein